MHILFANYQQGEANNYSQQIAKKLIQKHVDINHVDNNGLSPLHVAIKKSQIKAIEFAKFHNQSASEGENKFNFNKQGKTKFTPLHYAVFK